MRGLLVAAAIVLLCQVMVPAVQGGDVQPSNLRYELRAIRDGFEELYISLINVLSRARTEQSTINKNITTELVSMYAFNIQLLQSGLVRGQQAIDDRIAAIGGTPNQCILEEQGSFQDGILADLQLEGYTRQLAFDLNGLNYSFEELFLKIQRQASGYKYRVLSELSDFNFWTNLFQPLHQLESDLAAARIDASDAENNINRAIDLLEVRSHHYVLQMFSDQMVGYLIFVDRQINLLKNTLAEC